MTTCQSSMWKQNNTLLGGLRPWHMDSLLPEGLDLDAKPVLIKAPNRQLVKHKLKDMPPCFQVKLEMTAKPTGRARIQAAHRHETRKGLLKKGNAELQERNHSPGRKPKTHATGATGNRQPGTNMGL